MQSSCFISLSHSAKQRHNSGNAREWNSEPRTVKKKTFSMDAAVQPPRRPASMPMVQPPSLQDSPGDKPEDVRTWAARLQVYFVTVNLTRARDEQLGDDSKIALTLPLLGREGFRRILNNPTYKAWMENPATVTFAQFQEALNLEFGTIITVEKSRFDFFRRFQEAGETVQEFLGALRALASDCAFCVEGPGGPPAPLISFADAMLKTQLIIGASDLAAQQELMGRRHDPPLTLAATESFFVAKEAAGKETRSMGQRRTGNQVAVGAVQRQGGRGGRGANRSGQPQRQGSTCCRNCGNPPHLPSEPCPAANADCTACGRKGHYARMCRSSGQASSGRGGQNRGGWGRRGGRGSRGRGAALTSHMEAETHTVGVNYSEGQPVALPKILHTFSVVEPGQPRPLQLEVDTGAEATIISPSTHRAVFGGANLSQAGPRLRFIDGTRCRGWLGTLRASLQTGGRTVAGTIHVVKGARTDVVGRDFLLPLRATIQCGVPAAVTVGTIALDKQEVRRLFPELIQVGTGFFKGEPHRIKLAEGATPFAARLRPIPLARREAACEEIRKMDKAGVWEPVGAAQWAHPLVTVPKKDGGVRITTDLTKLNSHVIPDRHPIPRVRDIFNSLSRSKYFSKLDVSKGYWHIPLHPESRPLTTTITPLGLRQYTRLPMGLKDAASAFQKRIQQTLLGVPGAEVYIDDVIIHGVDRVTHDEALRCALQALQDAGFKLHPDKCAFGKMLIRAFGHLVGADGVKPDPANMDAIRNIPTPTSVAELVSFLGAINYFGESIPDLASTAEPLRQLTRRDATFEWGPQQDQAFKTLKAEVENATLRHGFDPALPTIVSTDASDVGVGGTLTQVDKTGKEIPIAFFSKTLDRAQRNYAANEREALACMLAVEHWENLLLGLHFTLRTDHQALESMLRNPKTRRETSKFPRWLQRLQAFDYTVQYLPGPQNKIPDYLSRLRERATALQVSAVTKDGLLGAYRSDPLAQELGAVIMKGDWGPWKEAGGVRRDFFTLRASLTVTDDGLILKEGKIWVPGTELRSQILREAHEGHIGIMGTKKRLRQTYWWKGMGRQVEELVQ